MTLSLSLNLQYSSEEGRVVVHWNFLVVWTLIAPVVKWQPRVEIFLSCLIVFLNHDDTETDAASNKTQKILPIPLQCCFSSMFGLLV